MFGDLRGIHLKADFDHKLMALGKTVIIRKNVNNQTITTEDKALKEGNTFRFSQNTGAGNGDIIELEEDKSRWEVISVENYKVGNIPISFNVTTSPIVNSPRQTNTINPEPSPDPEPKNKSEKEITSESTLSPEPKSNPEKEMTPEPNNNEWQKISKFIRTHTEESIVILFLLCLLGGGWLLWKLVINPSTNNPSPESPTASELPKVQVKIRLKWKDGLPMQGGYVTLISHGGPEELGRSNDQGYIYSVELPKEDGIQFEVSHSEELKTAEGRELNLKSNPPKNPIQWSFTKDSNSSSNSSPTNTIQPQESPNSSSDKIKVNMVCYWKGGAPVNSVMRGAGFSGFDKNNEPISNINATNERGFSSFFIDKDRFPISLKTDHPAARDAQQITITLEALEDDNVLPFNDCKFNRK